MYHVLYMMSGESDLLLQNWQMPVRRRRKAIPWQDFWFSGICVEKCTSSPRATALLFCFMAILTPTRENGDMPKWTLGSTILPLIGTAVPQIPLSSKLKQAHQRACKEAAWRCDGGGGTMSEGRIKKKRPNSRNPRTWLSLIQINICEW